MLAATRTKERGALLTCHHQRIPLERQQLHIQMIKWPQDGFGWKEAMNVGEKL